MVLVGVFILWALSSLSWISLKAMDLETFDLPINLLFLLMMGMNSNSSLCAWSFDNFSVLIFCYLFKRSDASWIFTRLGASQLDFKGIAVFSSWWIAILRTFWSRSFCQFKSLSAVLCD